MKMDQELEIRYRIQHQVDKKINSFLRKKFFLYSFNSEHHFRRDNLLSSRFGESLPSMDENNQQIIQIGSNLSRFPDGIFIYFNIYF